MGAVEKGRDGGGLWIPTGLQLSRRPCGGCQRDQPVTSRRLVDLIKPRQRMGLPRSRISDEYGDAVARP